MRTLVCLTAAGFILAVSTAGAAPISANGFSNTGDGLATQLVQNKKEETVTEKVEKKVKRVWRDLTGYKFDVACPAFAIPLSRSSCTITAKNRDEARAKCQAQNALCQIADAK